MDKTILVVGGAGYIGSHVNRMLHRAGYQTIVLDNLSRGCRETVLDGIFVHGDMGDPAALHRIFETYSIDAVMHFAAFIDVGESVADPSKYYLNNVVHTFNLLKTMLHHHVKYLIFSSTAAIFGNPLSPLIHEDHPCNPINPYGETKWTVEKMLRHFDSAYGLKFCSFRYFNAAGGDPEGKVKNYQTDSPNLIPRLLKSLEGPGGFLTINGVDYPTSDGTCIRDYVHIEDLGAAHIMAMEQVLGGAPSDAYNLGNGKGFSIRQVIHAAEAVLKQKIRTVEGKRRPGDPHTLLADPSKAARELNWHPRYSLEEMIEHAWKATQKYN